jgi:microcystin-dependent protein
VLLVPSHKTQPDGIALAAPDQISIIPDTNDVIPVKFAPLIAGNVAGNLASGIVPDVKLLALNVVKSGAATPFARKFQLACDVPLVEGVAAPDLTTLSASNLTSGTIPDARFPATLPAISGANLTGITSFVSGMILIWSGAANAIPTGWVLCDGTNSTPNLQGRFVVGYHTANGDYDVGDTGGAETVTLTVAQMPAHTHTATTKGTSGSHSWTQFGAGRNDWNYPGENSRGSATTASNGGGTAHENRPPFYALCYIMKS